MNPARQIWRSATVRTYARGPLFWMSLYRAYSRFHKDAENHFFVFTHQGTLKVPSGWWQKHRLRNSQGGYGGLKAVGGDIVIRQCSPWPVKSRFYTRSHFLAHFPTYIAPVITTLHFRLEQSLILSPQSSCAALARGLSNSNPTSDLPAQLGLIAVALARLSMAQAFQKLLGIVGFEGVSCCKVSRGIPRGMSHRMKGFGGVSCCKVPRRLPHKMSHRIKIRDDCGRVVEEEIKPRCTEPSPCESEGGGDPAGVTDEDRGKAESGAFATATAGANANGRRREREWTAMMRARTGTEATDDAVRGGETRRGDDERRCPSSARGRA
ncbi:hypothetical protein EDB84DRAFT_1444884 [Lactarius hengduanensis]|nr:hypothetical protein EDB84DRAFT_1444884 [Lactarius hengduanensis]